MNLGKKFWLAVLSFCFLLGGLLAVSVLVQRRQLLEKKAAVPTATLSFGTTSFEEPPGNPVITSVILDPGGQEVVGVDAVIDFTQGVLELVSVNNTWAKNNTNFKTLAPIVSETNCNFNLDVNNANQTGRLEFGSVTFDCEEALTCPSNDPNCARPVPNPANNIVNPLAELHFRVKSSATPGSTATIRFQHTPGSTTDSNVAPYVQAGESVNDVLLTATSVVNVVVASVGTPTPTPTLAPGTAQLDFQVKFQGINQQSSDQTVKITLKQGGSVVETFEDVNVSSDSSGVYSGTVINIPPGTYEVLVKGWAHLQKNVGGINLSPGSNNANWSADILLAGDTNEDDKVNSLDFAVLVGDYIPNTPLDSPADFDLNDQVNSLDFLFIVENYYQEGEK